MALAKKMKESWARKEEEKGLKSQEMKHLLYGVIWKSQNYLLVAIKAKRCLKIATIFLSNASLWLDMNRIQCVRSLTFGVQHLLIITLSNVVFTLFKDLSIKLNSKMLWRIFQSNVQMR